MPGDPHPWGRLRVNGPAVTEINNKEYAKPFTKTNDINNTPDTTTQNKLVDNNSEADKPKSDKHNKLMHTLHGNIEYNDLNVVQLNSGNGKWCLNDTLLKASIETHSPDIIIISESNINTADNKMLSSRRSRFKEFTFLDKVFRGTTNARLTVMVKNKHEFERKLDIENDTNPTIVLTIKTSARKNHTIIANYRQ